MEMDDISVRANLVARAHHPMRREYEDRIQCMLDLTESYYWEQDIDHRYTLIQPGEMGMPSSHLEEFIGKTDWEMGKSPILNQGSWSEYKEIWDNRAPFKNFIVWWPGNQEGEKFISISGKPIFDQYHQFKGYQGISKNVTAETLREKFSESIELLAIGISHVNSEGQFIRVNQQMSDMLGYSKAELLKLSIYHISHPDDEGLQQEIKIKLQSGKVDSLTLEQRYIRKDLTPIWVRLTIAVSRDPDGKILNGVSMVEDISERKKAEERIEYLATHDEMTDLPNRVLFSQLLRHTIKSAQRYKRKFAVLFIDLDRFKQINDSLGHDAGDMLLTEMAERFKNCIRTSDVIARLGGDEFVVIIQEVNKSEQVETIARNILQVTAKPFKILGQECRVTASIGICMYPEMANKELTLMQNADMAMYLAKEHGKNTFKFYTDEIKSLSLEKLEIEANLRHAMELNEFEIYYQPRVDIKTGRVKGVEALLRWDNAAMGSVSPVKFIPITEEMGMIVPLGKWVMKSACEQNQRWQAMGLPPVCISVNLSPRQFMDNDLVPFIKWVLTDTQISPELLELEITESMVMHNTEQAIEKMFEMKELGIRIAIDDFGTGYSSLAQLKRFPVDTLKIDRSFIKELPYETQDKAITAAIIVMGKLLGLTVVAEGVETAEQQTFLTKLNCDEIQGYYFSKPTTPEIFEKLLREYTPATLY